VALRLLEVAVARERESQVAELMRQYKRVTSGRLETSSSGAVFHVVLPAEDTETLMDSVESICASADDLRMVLVPAEALAAPSEEH
jgi:ATP phosphoribosyltransferase